VSVDQFEPEVEEWRRLARGVAGVEFEVGDDRRLPFPDGSFDHAYSISVIEHIGEDGDFDAFAELARVVRPGRRVVVTFPFGETAEEEWRDAPVYSEDGTGQAGRWFYQRRYDPARVERLLAAAPSLTQLSRRAVRFARSRFYDFYTERAPWTLPLGPGIAWFVKLEDAPGGLLFLILERMAGNYI
jgi:ubiquinone/menaquinone biosynthesis C-methylase UbiE